MFTSYLLVTKIEENFFQKARFILAAPKCFLKPLSKFITVVVEILFHHIENYND